MISLEPGSHPWSVGVQRLRLDPSEVGSAVAEIRDLLTARGRSASMWSVGSSATPADLPDRLQALGMVPEDGLGEAAMVLIRAPEPIPPTSFVVRLAETADENRAAVDVMIEAFGFSRTPRRPAPRPRQGSNGSGPPVTRGWRWSGRTTFRSPRGGLRSPRGGCSSVEGEPFRVLGGAGRSAPSSPSPGGRPSAAGRRPWSRGPAAIPPSRSWHGWALRRWRRSACSVMISAWAPGAEDRRGQPPTGTSGSLASAASSADGSNSTSGRRAFR